MPVERTARARLLSALAVHYKRSPVSLLRDIDAEETREAVFDGRVEPLDGIDYQYDDALSWAMKNGYVEVVGEYNPSSADVDSLPYYRLTDSGWELTEPHLEIDIYRFENTVEITEGDQRKLKVNPIKVDSFEVDEITIPKELGIGVYMCGMDIVAFDPDEEEQAVMIVDGASARVPRIEETS